MVCGFSVFCEKNKINCNNPSDSSLICSGFDFDVSLNFT
jgi:hypothetical protein